MIVYSITTMKITLEIPDSSLSITRERPEEFARSLRIAAAVKWYELGRISQSKAAELIGCNRIELFNHFREYGVSFLQLSEDDLEQELADSRI
jgi:predicted HTH domain antitoxin